MFASVKYYDSRETSNIDTANHLVIDLPGFVVVCTWKRAQANNQQNIHVIRGDVIKVIYHSVDSYYLLLAVSLAIL